MSSIGLILTNVVSKSPWALGGAGLRVSPPSDCLSPLYLWLLFHDILSLFYLLYILSLPQPNGTFFISFVTVSGKLLKSTSYRPTTPHARWTDTLRTPASSCISKSQAVRDSFTYSVFLFISRYRVDSYNTIIRTYLFLDIAVLTPWDAPVSSLLLV